jgi:2-dehydropantoate 2-reductase
MQHGRFSMMKVCVFGAGAIGGHLAIRLHRAGATVSVIARGPRLAAIRSRGLTVRAIDGVHCARIEASDRPAELGRQDAVFVTVKAPALPAVAASIGPLLGPHTPVAFVMNGIPWWYFHAHGGALEGRQIPRLDPKGALWRIVGPQRAIGGIFWPACSVPEPGVVRCLTGASRGTVLGEPDGSESPRITALAAAFEASGLAVSISPDIRPLIWHKLAFNLSAGPLCVLTETAVFRTQEEPVLVEASRQMVTEVLSLTRAMGITLDLDFSTVIATNTNLQHRPSILQDLEAGRPMEIDALYTVPLELAQMKNVATPTLDLIVSLIKVKARAKGLYTG